MLDNKIKLIQANIQAAQDHLAQIKANQASLEQDGMYPAIAYFQWQTRPGIEGQYLYLLFRQDANGCYSGPDGKRKLYIGADPAKIAEAHRLTNNRKTWERLKGQESQLNTWINVCQGKLIGLEREADRVLEHSQDWPEFILPFAVETAPQTT